jgi:hypothetical protein
MSTSFPSASRTDCTPAHANVWPISTDEPALALPVPTSAPPANVVAVADIWNTTLPPV